MSSKCYLSRTCKKYINTECDGTQDNFCQKLFRINSIYERAGLSDFQKKHIGLLVDSEDQECYNQLYQLTKKVQTIVDNGSNLYLYSKTPGNGKTSWAIKFIQSYVDSKWYSIPVSTVALFLNVPKFFSDIKFSFDVQNEWVTHVKKNVYSVDLVVWDDIGTKGLTDFEREMLLSIINARVENRKANIFTSNCSPKELESILQPRLASRILSNAMTFEFMGKDKRYLMGKEEVSE